ncbi:hypothetical protein MSAN_01989000 [Mycena sanguinolenta]|uniref:Uncharacterized protein n=1 Tax=Mycena sanguinolenta TaxID=230812 RepID=A0A8H6XLS2_9AGAR|nr:hypothetical protein MSAN_01989000 [Mycena sanguinolenta]
MGDATVDQFYVLQPEELSFLKKETGIHDDDELKAHVLAMQKAALEVGTLLNWRFISLIVNARFTRTHAYAAWDSSGKLKMPKNPAAYEHVLNLGKTVPGAILVELGCCLGNDVRKIASDGFPSENIIASDLREGFWTVSHKLYPNPPKKFAGTFIPGDALDPEFLGLMPILKEVPEGATPNLPSLKSLNPLHGRVSAIHTGSFFHLFSEEKQLEIARKFAGLLSPRPGSMIFGCHGTQPTKGFMRGSRDNQIFCHSPESWKEMWEEQVFEPGTVEVQSFLKNSGKVLNSTTDFWMLYWSVKRL